MLRQCYRDLLTRRELVPLLQYQANLFLDRNHEVLFGAQGSELEVSAEMRSRLSELAYPIWKGYVWKLWDVSGGDTGGEQQCIVLEGMLLLAPLHIDRNLEHLV